MSTRRSVIIHQTSAFVILWLKLHFIIQLFLLVGMQGLVLSPYGSMSNFEVGEMVLFLPQNISLHYTFACRLSTCELKTTTCQKVWLKAHGNRSQITKDL